MHYEEKYSSSMVSVCVLSTNAPTILSTPKYNMRQHQIAFRPKTNTYDAFSFAQVIALGTTKAFGVTTS
jgi:hypothetical protein